MDTTQALEQNHVSMNNTNDQIFNDKEDCSNKNFNNVCDSKNFTKGEFIQLTLDDLKSTCDFIGFGSFGIF